ncbi:MAG: hypothetical protein ACTSW4_02605 [Candidatus Ranarchaeia archaeon]
MILAYLILIPFILFNLGISLISFFKNRFTGFAVSLFGKTDSFARKNVVDRAYTFFWIVLGSVACLVSGITDPLSLLLTFLAFNSGGKITKQIIFTLHDMKILSAESGAIKGRLIKASVMFTMMQLLFLLAWGVTYRIASASLKTIFGLDAGIYVIIIWVSGLVVGILYGMARSRNEPLLLMKNELALFYSKKSSY